MARPAVAIMLALIGSAAAAATDGNGDAPTPAARLAPVLPAGRPNYVTGGWVCPLGFIWRNAGRQDWLCVEPTEARRIAWENRNAAAKAVRADDGSYRCPAGLVTRGAFKDDDVCVQPARRDMVHQMNLALFNAY